MQTNHAAHRTMAVLAFPLHGIDKFYNEGFRTRDAHLIEWMASLLPTGSAVGVASRPEPFPRRQLQNHRGGGDPRLVDLGRSVLALPHPIERQRWWAKSAQFYPSDLPMLPTVTWTPFAAMHFERVRRWPEVLVVDLLDDWSVHASFESIRRETERAYGMVLDRAKAVFANSEGTLALAHRFGRSDAVLMPNGVDPGKFSCQSLAAGPITVGYVGKIGGRLDPALIEQVATERRDLRFVFAGPFLDRRWRRFLGRLSANVETLGDVHYQAVPSLLKSFDIGWIPHRVGPGEVGGDAIKLYEYRAAGLPVLTTPILGVGQRPLREVHVLAADGHAEWLRVRTNGLMRVQRVEQTFGTDLTWRWKAERVLDALFNE